MAYIGNGPGTIRQGRRAVYEFTSTANQTAFSGTDENGLTLDLLQANDNDVYLNGVRLIITDDYTISGDVLTLTSGAASGDKLIIVTQDEIANDASYSKAASDSRYINYDGDIVNGTIQMGGSGNNITFADNNKAVFGDDSDLQIYHDNTGSYVKEGGTGSLYLQGTDVRIQTASGENILNGTSNGAVTLYHDNSPKIATTSTGIDVTGTVTADGLSVEGSASGNFISTIKNTHNSNGSGLKVMGGDDANTTAFRITDYNNNALVEVQGGGHVGIGTTTPTATLQVGNLVSGETGNAIINSEGGNPVGLKVASRVNRARIQVADNDTSGFIIAEDNIFSFGFADQASNNNLNITNSHNVGIGTTTPAHKLEVVGTTKAEQYLLDAVAKDISDTAVDVFIYDTRKDSDGGAWRKRTQHTSWYNETLNTSTRGARKEFPAVAVIVAESTQVTIYDGDDTDMPMWMVFNQAGAIGSASNIITANSTVRSLACINGTMCFGMNDSSTPEGTFTVNFISELSRCYRDVGSNYTGSIYTGSVSARNSNKSYEGDYNILAIVSQNINDVAMTVLPNAPIDSATGLPVPTIAVATNSGVSIIKDDGTVVNKVTTDAGTYSATVDFTKDGYLIVTRNNYSYFVITYLTAASATHPSSWPYLNYFRSNGVAFPGPNGPGNNPHGDQQYGLANRAISLDNNNVASADIYGLNVFNINGGLSSPSNSVAYITSDYNTGYMNGNIKLSTLSDTDDTNVSDTNLNPYTPATGNLGSITLNPKKTYKVTITGYGDIDGQWPGYGSSTDGVYVYTGNTTAPGVGQANLNIQDGGTSGSPISTTVYIKNFPSWTFYTWSTGTVTGYSIQECDYNRTVYCHPVEVVGTVTKSAVATGADLVAYSGFSGSNYLQQPYNSQLDFGTGDFSITGWINFTGSATRDIITRTNGTNGWILQSTGKRLRLRIHNSGDYIAYFNDVLQPNVWNHFVILRRSGYVTAFLNGKEEDSGISDNMTHTVSVNTPLLLSQNSVDKLALLRISATDPSPEQIKKMYNDEKHLFQENAKATLHGSSDAVTALAYDDDTELLHVGTSAGRSVFQGLRRIDNTTDAVGAAISASNGMVAED